MDRPVVQLLLASLPGLIGLSWIRRQDQGRLEPAPRVLWVFMLGGAAAIGVLFLRYRWEALARPASQRLPDALFDAFVVTALLEEWTKGIAFAVGAPGRRRRDEPCDGLVYGVAAGLGFATVETALVLRQTGDPSIVVLRSFTALLLHVGCTGLLGHALWRVRLGASRWRGIATFVEVVLLHGLYDLFLIAFPAWRHVSLLIALPALLAIFSFHVRRSCRGPTCPIGA